MALKAKRWRQNTISQAGAGPSFGRIVREQLRGSRLSRWLMRGLFIFITVALLGDFLANEKPLYCRLEGKTYFPVFHQYAVDLGLSFWEARFVQARWQGLPYEKVVFAPIPYSAHTLDRRNMNFKGPFDSQRLSSWRFRHWLGTDKIGRDVAAGMIRGARIALTVGMLAMTIATLIGLFLGALAGYFGDQHLRLPRGNLIFSFLALGPAWFYAFNVRGFALSEGHFVREMFISLCIFTGILVAANFIALLLRPLAWFRRRLTVPADFLIMRLIEIINAIPALLLILSVVAIIRKPSVINVMIIIGLLSWTGIAQFVRAELLRIRQQEYIEAAHALGFSDWRILFRHALPNAMTPVLITVAFGIAGAVLLESFLSFLGIGLAAESVTWGTMLNLARYQFNAWWLAIFPGLAIFFTVTLFNLIGERLTEAMDPRGR